MEISMNLVIIIVIIIAETELIKVSYKKAQLLLQRNKTNIFILQGGHASCNS